MKRTLIVMGVVLCAAAVFGKDILSRYSWLTLKEQGRVQAGEVIADGKGGATLAVRNESDGKVTVPLVVVEDPGVTAATYAVRGKIRYENVVGKAYLEMWSTFGENERCFSRTLSDSGVFAHITGSSDWRDFSIPFYLKDSPKRPTKLEVNLVLPGKGTVHVGSMRLVQYGPNEDPIAAADTWWTGAQSGLVAGLTGALFGIYCGILGTLGSKGKARGFVFGSLRVLVVLGVAVGTVGIFALGSRQPFGVYFPPFLIGILFIGLPVSQMKVLKKRYEQVELRRMEAQDV